LHYNYPEVADHMPWYPLSIGITPVSGTTSDTHMKHDIEVMKGKDFETSEVEAILSLMK